jgi:hypothetical protein
MIGKEKQKEMADAIEEVLTLHNVQVEAMAKQIAGEKGDFTGILANCEERLGQLREKAEEMLKNTGMTREQMNEYISNRANFSQEEWNMLEETRKTCEEMKEKDNKILRAHIPADILEKTEPEKKIKKRKKKTTKKNWMQL